MSYTVVVACVLLHVVERNPTDTHDQLSKCNAACVIRTSSTSWCSPPPRHRQIYRQASELTLPQRGFVIAIQTAIAGTEREIGADTANYVDSELCDADRRELTSKSPSRHRHKTVFSLTTLLLIASKLLLTGVRSRYINKTTHHLGLLRSPVPTNKYDAIIK